MLSPQETSDRLEIMAALAQYADAVDRRELDLLDLVFTPDADLDYTEIAPYRGDLAYTKEWLKVMPPSGTYQHLMVLPTIRISGDTAETRTPCINPMPAEDGMSLFGHWYRDRWVRTPEGWRICQRHFEACYKAAVARG
jgi:hypothetical protein